MWESFGHQCFVPLIGPVICSFGVLFVVRLTNLLKNNVASDLKDMTVIMAADSMAPMSEWVSYC